MPRMSKASDRKVAGKRYTYGEPRKVSYLLPGGRSETDSLTDVVRDLYNGRINYGDSEWNTSTFAERSGIASSTLHAILSGERDPNLTHLERICAVGRINAIDILRTHPKLLPESILEDHAAGNYPFAELRLRPNLSGEQLERIGKVVERAAGTGQTEWLVAIIEKIGEALSDTRDAQSQAKGRKR